MSELSQNRRPRLRAAMRILGDHSDGLSRNDLWARVIAEVPLSEHEASATKSGAQRGLTDFLFYTTRVVRHCSHFYPP